MHGFHIFQPKFKTEENFQGLSRTQLHPWEQQITHYCASFSGLLRQVSVT